MMVTLKTDMTEPRIDARSVAQIISEGNSAKGTVQWTQIANYTAGLERLWLYESFHLLSDRMDIHKLLLISVYSCLLAVPFSHFRLTVQKNEDREDVGSIETVGGLRHTDDTGRLCFAAH